MYDVIVIGAGVSGSATARELSRWEYWKKKRMYVVEHPRRTAGSFMPDLMHGPAV